MKMNIAIRKTEEVELPLPYFFKRKNTGRLCGIITETQCVSINDTEIIYYSDMHEPISQFLKDGDNIEISAEEFTRVFDERIEQLQSLKSHFFTNK